VSKDGEMLLSLPCREDVSQHCPIVQVAVLIGVQKRTVIDLLCALAAL
jgi:hypothetical protein